MKPHYSSDYSIEITRRSPFYREIMEEKRQILQHKWLESEKAGEDIGFEKALFSWVRHHRTRWLKSRKAIHGF